MPLAVQFVENEIRRLLEGGCELSEMVMTGGLWRITGDAAELTNTMKSDSYTDS